MDAGNNDATMADAYAGFDPATCEHLVLMDQFRTALELMHERASQGAMPSWPDLPPVPKHLQFPETRSMLLHETSSAFMIYEQRPADDEVMRHQALAHFVHQLDRFISHYADKTGEIDPTDPVQVQEGSFQATASSVLAMIRVLLIDDDIEDWREKFREALATTSYEFSDEEVDKIKRAPTSAADFYQCLKQLMLIGDTHEALQYLREHSKSVRDVDPDVVLALAQNLELAHHDPARVKPRAKMCTARAHAAQQNGDPLVASLFHVLGGNAAMIASDFDTTTWQQGLCASLRFGCPPPTSRDELWDQLTVLLDTYEAHVPDGAVPFMSVHDELVYRLLRRDGAAVLTLAMGIDPWLATHLAAVFEELPSWLGDTPYAHLELHYMYLGYLIYASRAVWRPAVQYWEFAGDLAHLLHMALMHRVADPRQALRNPRRARLAVQHAVAAVPDLYPTIIDAEHALARDLDTHGRPGMAVSTILRRDPDLSMSAPRAAVDSIVHALLRRAARNADFRLLLHVQGMRAESTNSRALHAAHVLGVYLRDHTDRRATYAKRARALVDVLDHAGADMPPVALAALLDGTVEVVRHPEAQKVLKAQDAVVLLKAVNRLDVVPDLKKVVADAGLDAGWEATLKLFRTYALRLAAPGKATPGDTGVGAVRGRA
ncbi:hypothetical protein GGF31_005958 [Allomyces arbusculus]|nr:hypothetical protein GGF31_005958 [Allomyces arbusculus]